MFFESWYGVTGGYYERLYYVKDQPPQRRRASLGSTRVTISTVETGNNVAYASDYYPFGESIREFQVGTKGGKYKFTEKERDAESSYDYFGARYYNNKLGVWLSADPLADKYHGWSPYNYTMDNPIVFYDPDGNEIKIAGNKTIAMNDMKELAGGSNAKYVSANADGVISLSKDYKYEAGSGAELLYNLVNNENSFTHEVGYSTNYSSAKGKNVAIDLQNPNDAMGLASAVKGGMQNSVMPTMQPKENQGNAHILVSPTATWSKDGKPVSRTNIIFHELKEKLLMVTQGLIKYGSEGNTNTAHYKAGQAGIKRASVDNIDSNGAEGSVDKKETK